VPLAPLHRKYPDGTDAIEPDQRKIDPDGTPLASTKAVVAIWVVFVLNAAVGATGVPVNVGEDIVGAVPNTATPVPVSSVKAAAKLAEEGVLKNVATPVPKELTPVPPEPADSGFVSVTACAALIAIAVVPLVWIAIAPVVSAITFSAVAVVVPAFRIVAILGSRCRS
jgi:hypothetical protein